MFRKNNKGIAPVIIVIIIGIVLLLFMCCCCGGCSSCVGGNSTSSGTNTESTVSNTASSYKNEENDIQTDTEEVKEPEEVVETVLDPTPVPENETQIAQDSSISQSATEEPKNAEATVEKQETSNTPTVEQPKEETKEVQKEEPKKEETKKEEIIIPESFDAAYYAANNPDVVAAVGESPEALYKHYQNYGKKEGRSQNASEEAAKLAKLEEEKQALLQAEAAKQAEEARKAEEAAKQAEQAQNSNSSSNQTVTNNNQSSSSSSSGGYVLNTNTKKFHLPGCSSVNKMKEKNKLYSNQSRDEIISQGYDPCKNCNP